MTQSGRTKDSVKSEKSPDGIILSCTPFALAKPTFLDNGVAEG